MFDVTRLYGVPVVAALFFSAAAFRLNEVVLFFIRHLFILHVSPMVIIA